MNKERLECSDYSSSFKQDFEDDIVISGVAGKFPDSRDVYHFRDNLFNKVDLVSEDTRRWKPIHPEVPQRTGKLFDVDKFDSGYFGITSRQCDFMDPTVRLNLELSVEALMDAGYNPSDIANTDTAVISGACMSETERFVFHEIPTHSSDPVTGCNRSMMSKRISHALKLKGPSMVVDTACSSSLFALEIGFSMLKSGRCDKVLVAGGSLCLHPIVSLQFARLGVLSRDGSCKSFDDSGNGYARSEGSVVILVQRRKDAKRVYAELIYAKTNCDGYKKEGITFPSSDLQKVLLKDVYEECKIDPRLVTYMEAHGTGTKVGDPEELRTLDEIFCTGRDRPLHIGAVKSNIGHNEPASGLCSIVKTLIAMETGYIPPNLHYKTPRAGIEPLEKGRMIVVSEKLPLPDDKGLFGVNSFGFGGANVHVLLLWNSKTKLNNGQPNDDLPRLICVNSRSEEGVTSILDDYKSRDLDAEHAYLIHQVFKKPVANNIYRGFGIYSTGGEIERSLVKFEGFKRRLCFVFTSLGKNWLKIGQELLEIPLFAKTMKGVYETLSETANINLYEMLKNNIEEGSTSHILGSVCIQVALANLLNDIRLLPDETLGYGNGKFAASYLNEQISLKQTILNVFDKIPLVKKNPKDTRIIEHANENAYQNGFNGVDAKFNGHQNGFSIDINGAEHDFHDDIVHIVIGDETKNTFQDSINLINSESKNCVRDLLKTLGRLYEYGYDMELDKLYPSINLPVSRGTPMISPLVRWNRDKSWMVHVYNNEIEIKSGNRIMHIVPKTEDWNFILGHVIDGRSILPATGYLILVWESLALMEGKLFSEMKIVFEDIKFLRATHVHQDGCLELTVTIQTGFNNFEISEAGTSVVTGKVYDRCKEEVINFPDISFNESELYLTEKDIYKELRIRGYHYTGKFRNIRKSNDIGSHSIVEWEHSWIPFVDSLLQLSLLQEDTRNTYVPTSIQYLGIDAPKHITSAVACNNMIPVELFKDLNIARTSAIEMRGLGANPIPRRKGGDPVLETYKFVPNKASLETNDSIRAMLQLILENSNAIQVKVVEVLSDDNEEHDLLCGTVQKALEDMPLIRQKVTVLSSKPIEPSNVTVENKPLETESNALILILSNILETTEISIAANVVKDAKGFIISREHLKVDLTKFDDSALQVLCSFKTEKEMLVLLKPFVSIQPNIITLDVSDPSDDFNWIPKLQNVLKSQNKIVLYSQNNPVNGLLGLINCLRREAQGNKLFAVCIMDEAPAFDIELDFYKEQLEKNLVINIWKDGAWGTYRHLLLPEINLVENEHCYVNATRKGDLSSIAWIEGTLNRNDPIPIEKELVHIYYASLNFRDLMIASGKLIPDAITKNRVEQECIQGFEFAGRNSKGKRVMGMFQTGSLASMTACNKHFVFEIPDEWSLEEAATVPVVYGTVLQAFVEFQKSFPKPGETILIHSGTGGIGLAAINLSIYFGLTIFVTVGTEEKRNFIKTHYPQINHEHIGNSRDLSFELMIQKCTTGRGVDYVLNSLAEDKLLASVRCLARGGNFIEIGKFDLASNNALVLKLLEKEARFNGVAIDKFLVNTNVHLHVTASNMIKDFIRCGAIKPLPRTIFKDNEVEKAFRYMGTGKHIGKILIKVRDEEMEKVYSVPRRYFKGVARFSCNPSSSYIIIGGLGGFGLELADWLVVRGTKKLVLTSKSGLTNGYQKYRMRIWKSYGVEILTSTIDASTKEGCVQLLKIANNLGPVDGIFNLAVILKDAIFENQTAETFETSFAPKARSTRYLDVVTRELCPNLRYFVVFSSISCGLGNVGQTNYGMANSIMERICEKRKLEGYPGLAIQWGAVGDVGLVAKMQEDHKELVIGGTLQQSISSCLQVLDNLLKQNEPIVTSMVVAEKRYGTSADNMFDTVLNILGVTNLKTISIHSTFPELGMDSMMAVEVKQTLEREYEIFLTAQDIKEMTLSKLKDISHASDDVTVEVTTTQEDLPADIKLLLHYIGNEKDANTPVIRMKTLIEGNEDAPHIFALPGIEGMAVVLESLCKKLKAHVSCLQFCNESKAKTVKEMALSVLPYVERTESDEIIILAYSYGTTVAVELLRLLESIGRRCRLIFIDGSPELLTELTKKHFPVDDKEILEVMLLSNFMMRYVSYDYVVKHQQIMMTHKSFQEKIDYMISVSPKVDVSKKYIEEMCFASYYRISAALKYKPEGIKLTSPVTLFKAGTATSVAVSKDFGLSKLFEEVDVIDIDGNHLTILENNDLYNYINNILKTSCRY